MVEGEILIRENKLDAGIAALREAIKLEDALHYDEPPGWLIPVRHSLGAVLMKQQRFAEAEQVYRDDLVRSPENGWSLFGLTESLRGQKKNKEEAKVMNAVNKQTAHASPFSRGDVFTSFAAGLGNRTSSLSRVAIAPK
jgi:predicted Zn-dependent protease